MKTTRGSENRTGPEEGRESRLAALPAVDELLRTPEGARWLEHHPRSVVVGAIRDVLDTLRREIRAGGSPATATADIVRRAEDVIIRTDTPRLRRVINATGVIVHTNLGRSILSEPALLHAVESSRYYSNLEFDLGTGGRGHRDLLVRDLLVELTGAEDALVVNNNAAAVLLALTALARDREVIVSRGELIEIGGSFRIPDVMAAGGAVLREVGTTNKTHLRDYDEACGEETALFLKVHPSNYRVVGFHAEVTVSALKELGARRDVPVMVDLGSGALVDLSPFGIQGEPPVSAVVREGADLVTFSGDKLLGGPQGGVVVGRNDLVSRLRRHPLARALRVDKLTLAAFEGTLRLYREPARALKEIPTLAMLTMPYRTIKARAGRTAGRLRKTLSGGVVVRTFDGVSRAGGGALPEKDVPTRLIGIRSERLSPRVITERLLETTPPLIARVQDDELILDLRTVAPKETPDLIRVLNEAVK